MNNEGVIELKNAQIMYDVHGMKEYVNEFERIRYQRISAKQHDPNDTIISKGVSTQVQSRNPVREGYAPDPFYVSHGNQKIQLN